jgi:hypothetical protein
MTGVPTWVVGEVLAAADVNAWFVPLVAKKPTTQSVVSQATTMQNDTALVLPVAASAIYEMKAHIIYNAAAAADIILGWTAPAAAAMDWVTDGLITSESTGIDAVSRSAQSIGSQPGVGGDPTNRVVLPYGILTTGATAGNLQFQWMQNVSSATATQVVAGSALILRRIG